MMITLGASLWRSKDRLRGLRGRYRVEIVPEHSPTPRPSRDHHDDTLAAF